MQDVLEGDESVASNLANFCLLNESIVEQAGGVVFLFLTLVGNILAIFLLLLLRHGSRNVETHLHKLVPRPA